MRTCDFTVQQVLKGVYHIQDPLRVCVTLLVGDDAALLYDTGYGLYDLPALVRGITRLPLTVLLGHGHHDHACGAAQFDEVFAHEAELSTVAKYTAPFFRDRVFSRAEAEGVLPKGLDAGRFLGAGSGAVRPLERGIFPLGGLTARMLPMPGHTPGSIGLYVEERALLLTGDNWNPTTWLFFPESAPLPAYANMMRGLSALPFRHVLAPHVSRLFPAERLRAYIDGLTPQTFDAARPSPIAGYERINIHVCHPEPHTALYFDRDKHPYNSYPEE